MNWIKTLNVLQSAQEMPVHWRTRLKLVSFLPFHVFRLLRAKYCFPAATSEDQIIHLWRAATYEDGFIVLISSASIVSILLVCLTSD